MHANDQELQNTITRLTDEQLLRMLRIEFAEYRQEALELAEAELQARGVSLSENLQQPSSPSTQDEEGQCRPVLSPAEVSSSSPFDQLRARSLPIWLCLVVPLFALLTRLMAKGKVPSAGE